MKAWFYLLNTRLLLSTFIVEKNLSYQISHFAVNKSSNLNGTTTRASPRPLKKTRNSYFSRSNCPSSGGEEEEEEISVIHKPITDSLLAIFPWEIVGLRRGFKRRFGSLLQKQVFLYLKTSTIVLSQCRLNRPSHLPPPTEIHSCSCLFVHIWTHTRTGECVVWELSSETAIIQGPMACS